MIIDVVEGDVLADADAKVVVFAVNVEGANDAGFAGQVARAAWPELAHRGPTTPGVLSHEHDGRRFYAIVCHSLGEEGWEQAPLWIERGLNEVNRRERRRGGSSPEVADVVLMGAGAGGQARGADVLANLGAIARSRAACRVWTLPAR